MAPDEVDPSTPGWKRDPTGRFAGRYWDGQGWTDHVVTAERDRDTDRYEAPEPPPPPRGPLPTALPHAVAGSNSPSLVHRLRAWPRWAKWTVGIVLVLFIIGIASSGSNDKEKIGTGQAANTTQASPAQVPATTVATVAPPTTSPPTTVAAGPKTTFGNGQYRVGTDIAPGTYVAPGGTTCYWERQSTFGGSGVESIIANDLSQGGQVVVTIAASDKGFKTSGCGTWKMG